MKVLIQKATLVHPSHPLHGKPVDMLIEDGIISAIDSQLPEKDCQTITAENLHVSAGWMDCFANFCDPGQEYKETVETGAMAAAAGGYTDVMLIPNVQPAVSNKSQVKYLIQKGQSTPVRIHPIGAITRDTDEKELAEMYDMANAGAIAFSDGKRPLQSSGFMQKALEYVIAIDATVIQLPDDLSIGTHGLMNEGIVSTQLGLAGKPALSEELLVARDIELVRYTRSRIHFTGVSTQKSLQLIAAAKKDGLKVSCSVTPYHLYFSDQDLSTYDTNLKLNPPLRTAEDREALRRAVEDGTVDFIASHHQPQDYDHKVCEFEKAAFGMETLEIVFPAARTAMISVDRFVKMQTDAIRTVFGLPHVAIAAKSPACLTLFTPDGRWTMERQYIRSKSSNNAFIGRELEGRIIGTINKGQVLLNDNDLLR